MRGDKYCMVDEKKLIEEMDKIFPSDFLYEKNWFCGECSFMDMLKELIEKVVRKEEDWISCSERMPENETEVEISCVRKYIGAGDKKKIGYFTARAFYIDGTLTTEDSNFVWEDCDDWKYVEEKDAYIIPEGWWEYSTFSEKFVFVDAEVVAWKPTPEPLRIQINI